MGIAIETSPYEHEQDQLVYLISKTKARSSSKRKFQLKSVFNDLTVLQNIEIYSA